MNTALSQAALWLPLAAIAAWTVRRILTTPTVEEDQ